MKNAKTLRMLAGALALGALFSCAGCELGVVGPEPAYYGDYPPDTYIATTEPVYFEGRATYWYGGRWYYRDGRSWRHYEREPQGLYQHRMQGGPQRHTYEQWHGRPAGRANWRGRRR